MDKSPPCYPLRSLIVAASVLAACGSRPPAPPTAVVRATPASVCQGDDYATTIALDASASSPSLALVPLPPSPDAPPLSFSWAFSGAAVRELSRSGGGMFLDVATAADRPLHVQLTVSAQDGGSATTLHTIPITVADPASCPKGPCCAK
jgi:hypothetical protein